MVYSMEIENNPLHLPILKKLTSGKILLNIILIIFENS